VPGIGSPSVYWDDNNTNTENLKTSWNWENPITGNSATNNQHLIANIDTFSERPAQQDFLDTGKPPLLRLIGQIAKTYLAAEGPDGLYLVDQHAAHERVLFEKMMSMYKKNDSEPVTSQSLLQPVSVNIPLGSVQLLLNQLEVISNLGFKVEPFGPGTFIVRSVPVILAHMDPSAALRVIVEEFEEDETPLQAEIETRIAARICKRAAVKSGQVLSGEEQRSLLSDLEACESPRTCPHGRPTMIHISVDLLERQFGRRGAR